MIHKFLKTKKSLWHPINCFCGMGWSIPTNFPKDWEEVFMTRGEAELHGFLFKREVRW